MMAKWPPIIPTKKREKYFKLGVDIYGVMVYYMQVGKS